MSSSHEKFSNEIDEAVERLVARASNARGLNGEILRPRINAALDKYVFRDDPDAGRNSLRTFIDEVRADELCLIVACERGDEAAWEELVATFDATVRSAARKMTSNAEDGEDLAGSIWAELYGLRQDEAGKKKSKLGYYSGRGSLAGWLRAVVSQLAIDEHRKQSKFVQIEEAHEFENLAEDASNQTENERVLHHGSNPEELLTEKRTSADISSALSAAIASLADEDRLIVKMYYFDDLKLKDIAATFGYHEATASRKLVRVQSEIRKGVERMLKKDRGWSDDEIKRYLSDAASRLGTSIERMVAVWAVIVILQELVG
jgi:RNA polymerase sigma-70 factor